MLLTSALRALGRARMSGPLRSVNRPRACPRLAPAAVTLALVELPRAEIPANPVRRSTVWMIYPGSTNAVGVQYKYRHSDS